jgi:hypothetical protein
MSIKLCKAKHVEKLEQPFILQASSAMIGANPMVGVEEKLNCKQWDLKNE